MLFTGKVTQQAKGLCAIYWDAAGLAVAYAKRDGDGELHVTRCQFFPDLAETDLQATLNKFVAQHQLKKVPCTWVLPASKHLFLQIESLPVPAHELRQAVAWRIKDLLDFPLADAVIDVLEIPLLGAGQKRKGLYVTVAQQSYLQHSIEIIHKSGLQLQIIDISELALRNIAGLYADEALGLALLALGAQSCEFIISRQQELYFSRRFSLDIADIAASSRGGEFNQRGYDTLALEITRCYDYYRSQLHQNAPQKLILAPTYKLHEQAIAQLQALLDMPVELLKSDKLLTPQLSLDNSQACLFALGGILRDEVNNRETTS